MLKLGKAKPKPLDGSGCNLEETKEEYLLEETASKQNTETSEGADNWVFPEL